MNYLFCEFLGISKLEDCKIFHPFKQSAHEDDQGDPLKVISSEEDSEKIATRELISKMCENTEGQVILSIRQRIAILRAFGKSLLFAPEKGKLIFLEGGIGAGKTTLGILVTLLATRLRKNCLFMEEPMNLEKLQVFISDQVGCATDFQKLMLNYRVVVLELACCMVDLGYSVILDRSLYGDRVFEYVNWLDGNINNLQHREYLKTFSEIRKKYEDLCSHAVVLYMPQTTEGCVKRVQRRRRGNEASGYSLEYLQKINSTYAMYIFAILLPFCCFPPLVLVFPIFFLSC